MSTSAPSAFMRSDQTQRLVDRFVVGKIGELVLYSELRSISGLSQQALIGRMSGVKNIVEREGKIVLDCVRKVGYRIAPPEAIAHGARQEIRTIGRRAHRASRRLACTAVAEVPTDYRAEYLAAQSLFGALKSLTKTSMIQKLEAKVNATPQRLPVDATLGFFLGSNKPTNGQ